MALPAACEAHTRQHNSAGAATAGGLKGGAWGYCAHLRAYGLNFDFGLANSLLALRPSSSFEFGCGLGLYTSWLYQVGDVQPAIGVEPMPMPSSIFRAESAWPQQLVSDLLNESAGSQECVRALGQQDLVFSIEVAEHIPRHLHAALADLLVSRTRGFLVFSAGRPGQPGRGHIANRPTDEWEREFTSRGMIFLPRTTARFRGASRNGEIRRNVRVFAAARAQLGMALDAPQPGTWGEPAPSASHSAYVSSGCRAQMWRGLETTAHDKCNATHAVSGRKLLSVTRHYADGGKRVEEAGRLFAVPIPGHADGSSQRAVNDTEAIWFPRHRLRQGELALWPALVQQAADDCWGYMQLS